VRATAASRANGSLPQAASTVDMLPQDQVGTVCCRQPGERAVETILKSRQDRKNSEDGKNILSRVEAEIRIRNEETRRKRSIRIPMSSTALGSGPAFRPKSQNHGRTAGTPLYERGRNAKLRAPRPPCGFRKRLERSLRPRDARQLCGRPTETDRKFLANCFGSQRSAQGMALLA